MKSRRGRAAWGKRALEPGCSVRGCGNDPVRRAAAGLDSVGVMPAGLHAAAASGHAAPSALAVAAGVEEQPVGAGYSVHLVRPARPRGPAHRVGPAVRPSQPAWRPLPLRHVTVAAPVPRRGAPSTWTGRVATSSTNSTYSRRSRRSNTAATVNKSTASTPLARARRSCRRVSADRLAPVRHRPGGGWPRRCWPRSCPCSQAGTAQRGCGGPPGSGSPWPAAAPTPQARPSRPAAYHRTGLPPMSPPGQTPAARPGPGHRAHAGTVLPDHHPAQRHAGAVCDHPGPRRCGLRPWPDP
jgi:hypothetical protein